MSKENNSYPTVILKNDLYLPLQVYTYNYLPLPVEYGWPALENNGHRCTGRIFAASGFILISETRFYYPTGEYRVVVGL